MRSIINANPGFYLVHKDGQKYFKGESIIAWVVNADKSDYNVDPVTVEGVHPCEGDYWEGVMQPDGAVVIPGVVSYESLDKANEDLQKEVSSGT